MNKEAISKYYQQYKLYVFPAIVALSSLILIIFVIYPQTIKLLANQKVQGEITNKSKFLEAKAQTLESYDSSDLNQKVDSVLGAYPAEKDFVSALSLLQNLTAQSGFSATSISLGTGSAKNAGVESYNIKLDILGPIVQLPTLLSNIENSPRLMKVSSVETSIGKDSESATISLNVEVLYSSAPQIPGSIDSPLQELSQQDEEVIAKLARVGSNEIISKPPTTQLGPRGKANPFE